jgi:hypothetical protein
LHDRLDAKNPPDVRNFFLSVSIFFGGAIRATLFGLLFKTRAPFAEAETIEKRFAGMSSCPVPIDKKLVEELRLAVSFQEAM